MLDRLSPSPQLQSKMQPQLKGITQGNDFIAWNIVKNGEKCHKVFRHFFGCQEPTTLAPKKEQCPNYKYSEYKTRCGKLK